MSYRAASGVARACLASSAVPRGLRGRPRTKITKTLSVPLQSVSENIQTNYVNCDLCKADDGETVLEKLGGTYVKRRQCGFVYTNPLFDVEAVNTTYFAETKQRYIDISYGGPQTESIRTCVAPICEISQDQQTAGDRQQCRGIHFPRPGDGLERHWYRTCRDMLRFAPATPGG
jgi:hypothetical protein